MNWHDLIGFILVLAAAAAIPGPDIAAIVGSGLSGGLSRAAAMILGIMLGHAVWMTAAFTGLAALALALGGAFIVIKAAAVAYLLYLAWKLWTAPVSASPEDITFGSASRPQVRSIRRGASTEARPTAWIIGKFFFRRSSPLVTDTSALCALASSRTAFSSASGPMSLVGVLTRSRARKTPSATRPMWPASAPAGKAKRRLLTCLLP